MLQSYKNLQDKVGKTFCVSTMITYTLGNEPLVMEGSDGLSDPHFTKLNKAGMIQQVKSTAIS